jgi:UDP-N-acetylmuramyl pentapeptide phosphotransferase/UDP-N-acetylglucosamine-1-phosphate transferase
MVPVLYALIPVAAALVTAALIAWLVRGAHALPVDHPNERSLHTAPVPRVGGIAMFAALVPALLAIGWQPLLVGLAAALAALSFLDDRKGLPVAARLGAHGVAAAAFVLVALPGLPIILAAALIVALVWMTNLYNFMDGSDGLAGGMALFGFGAYAAVALLDGDIPLAAASAAVVACAAAFLVFNFHPAKVFMGDAGSIPLGFLAGVIGLAGWHEGRWPIWLPVLAFAPFLCDATLTLLKRLWRGERVWRAHRDHYYQRLVRMGFGHRDTAFLEYAVMAGCAIAAVVLRSSTWAVQVAALAGAVAVLVAIAVWVDLRWSKFVRQQENIA